MREGARPVKPDGVVSAKRTGDNIPGAQGERLTTPSIRPSFNKGLVTGERFPL
jgi:hypothetical protein